MKFVLMICALLPLAVFASSVDDSEQLSDLDANLFKGALSLIDDETIECLKKALTKTVKENKDLKWWFKDVKKTAMKLVETARDCLESDDDTKCLKNVKLQAEPALRRLMKAVPKENKEMINKLKEYVMKCI